MNINLLPLAPGHFVVIDHYEGLKGGAVVAVFNTAEMAAKSVEASYYEMSLYADMDPMTFDLDYNCTELVRVESFIS